VAARGLSGVSRSEHRHNTRALQVAGPDAFEMCADAAQFGSYKAVHKMQTTVQPCEQFIFDFIVDRQRDLGALGPDLSEISDAHDGNVPAHGFKRILVRRIAVHRQKHGVRLEIERSAKAEIDCLR